MAPRRVIDRDEVDRTAAWIVAHQRADGGIPWFRERQLDPWNHLQCAMALTAAGLYREARAAFRHLATGQLPEGAWPSLTTPDRLLDSARDTNHASYLASALWHHYLATDDVDLLAELWPTLDRALEFVLRLLQPDGVLLWAADPTGAVWPAPLLAGSSSAHGSLRCAARIAERLGHDRPLWTDAAERLAATLRGDHREFVEAEVPQAPGHFGMDWYYPVLGGAVRGAPARARLAADYHFWVHEGLGCRCVADRPWYTVAETCELAITLDTCGDSERARDLFSWVHARRDDDGGYWTGTVLVDGSGVVWPEERPTWTAATVVLAADVMDGQSKTSTFFRDLDPNEPTTV
jgi:hypothetical protein